MQIEFLKQKNEGMITTGDEIILWDCDEDMMNGPHHVAEIDEAGSVTLLGIRQNEGTVSTIFVGDEE
ncbi:hypothetical protein [Acinetobacter sp.]|uniref:hypothetical protein n=1 Tax=Acinetobacter sp. TaxID=472 RepID=UPI00388DB26A